MGAQIFDRFQFTQANNFHMEFRARSNQYNGDISIATHPILSYLRPFRLLHSLTKNNIQCHLSCVRVCGLYALAECMESSSNFNIRIISFTCLWYFNGNILQIYVQYWQLGVTIENATVPLCVYTSNGKRQGSCIHGHVLNRRVYLLNFW